MPRRKRRRYRKNPVKPLTVALIAGGALAGYYLFLRPKTVVVAGGGAPAQPTSIYDLGSKVLDIVHQRVNKPGATQAPSGQRYGMVAASLLSKGGCYDYQDKKYVAASMCGQKGTSGLLGLGSLSSEGSAGTLTNGGHTLSSHGYGSLR